MVRYNYKTVKVSGPYEDTIRSKDAIEKNLKKLGEEGFQFVGTIESEERTNYIILQKTVKE